MMKFNSLIKSQWTEGAVIANLVQGIYMWPVSKNASTHMRMLLGCGIHAPYTEIDTRNMIGLAVVREPVDRFISGYIEILKLRRDSETEYTTSLPFYSIKNPEKRFMQFLVDIEDNIYDSHLLPQVYQIFKPELVDYYILFDTFVEDMRKVIKKHGWKVRYSVEKRLKETGWTNLRKHITNFIKDNQKVQEKILDMYKEDYELYCLVKNDHNL